MTYFYNMEFWETFVIKFIYVKTFYGSRLVLLYLTYSIAVNYKYEYKTNLQLIS